MPTFTDSLEIDPILDLDYQMADMLALPFGYFVFTPGLEIVISDQPLLPGDTGLEFRFDEDPAPRGFPLMSSTEIIYPVVPVSEANKVLTRMDSEEHRVTNKVAAPVPREVDTIRFRVDTSYLPTFLGDLDANRLVQFRLATPGYTPFGGTSEDNYVRVLTRSRPQREDRGLTQLVDVTFRFMAVYP